jgi:SpoVK/Ycf46/Vps4 family AAA+-type ATPase
MTRMRQVIDLRDFYRYAIIFGPGIADIFLLEDGRKLDFLECLTEDLKSKGYQRILHISPTIPVHVMDETSEQLAANHLWHLRKDILTTGIVQDIHVGPYGQVNPNKDRAQYKHNQDGLGDVNGIRLVDAMINEVQSFRTALIIYNSEIFLTHFSNKRILGGVFSEWLQLPLENQNTIFFVFTNSEKEDLENSIKSIQVPEIKAIFDLEKGNSTPCFCIGGPNSEEINNLLSYLQVNNNCELKLENKNLFSRWIEAEELLLRTWYDRFSLLKIISLEQIRANGWITATTGDSRSIEEKIEELVGLKKIKERILEIHDWMKFQNHKQIGKNAPNLHMIFFGNPGTGKTTLARMMGEMFHEFGVLSKGHLVEVKGSDLIAEVVGGTSIKTNRAIDRAIGGVLFIDEAYSLSSKERGGFGQEAIETLLLRMENERSRLVVILAGYPGKMREFLSSNPGLERRFHKGNRFEFPDFTHSELESILRLEIRKRDLIFDNEFASIIPEFIQKMRPDGEGFGNAGEIRNLVDSIERRCKARSYKEGKDVAVISNQDLPEEYQDLHGNLDLDDLNNEFKNLIGLENIKEYLLSMTNLIRLEKIRDGRLIKTPAPTLIENFIFVGNPGTGKTTVARMIGKIYKSLGLLRRGHTLEVSATNLIAGYVGQTHEKTRDVLLNALDGVLFIDEAYALSRNQGMNSSSYGQESIDTIIKFMEDYRDRIVIIAAGYPEEMGVFLLANPGLRSRIGTILQFNDFTSDELIEILKNMQNSEGYYCSNDTLQSASKVLENMRIQNPKNFGNARETRRLFAYMKRKLADRIFSTLNLTSSVDINEFIPSDLIGFDEAEQSLTNVPYLLPQQFLATRRK